MNIFHDILSKLLLPSIDLKIDFAPIVKELKAEEGHPSLPTYLDLYVLSSCFTFPTAICSQIVNFGMHVAAGVINFRKRVVSIKLLFHF